MSKRVRFLTSVASASGSYNRGTVATVADAFANGLYAARYAIPEPATPSGTIGSWLTSAGLVPMTPAPSGGFTTASGVVSEPPATGAFYCDPNQDTKVTVFYPGEVEAVFDIFQMVNPILWKLVMNSGARLFWASGLRWTTTTKRSFLPRTTRAISNSS